MSDDRLSVRQREFLERAAARPGGFVCPTPLYAPHEGKVLDALVAKGLVTPDDVPRITDAGRAALKGSPDHG